ncbi:gamma-glutamylcyclotransferase family protein [Geobacter sp. SVR]|uniref:gamma-glutamylcyclotransferase family protein n=1 Tax=Geobacter sp. SVR TaxID=2495594 RepID=UPI00143F0245|nr:gamma-glutamylcyclotransferase family protein [Geobacter sp. SVR]BCS55071.1 gamma-glutamylcyclotransferase [Geobacter sp. SVR]GCF85253.1 gamma-glutamylcyclotransferase [Geobacter sp. SVR]
MSDHLIFSYAANMNPRLIASRCSKPEPVTVARLPDHSLAFFGYSKRWDGGAATLIDHPGEDLWGVVYKLSFWDTERLDSWLDVRLDGTGDYFLLPTEVIGVDGTTYPVLLYRKFYHGGPQQPPSEDYLETILAGAVAHGLPVPYIETVRRIRTKQATFPVPRIFEREQSSTFGTMSCDCGALNLNSALRHGDTENCFHVD